MSLSHQKFREVVVQLLYSYDVGKIPDEEAMVNLLMKELAITKSSVLKALVRVKQILLVLDRIDADISAVSRSYDISRIHSVEKNVIRLGVYELLYEKLLPPKVVIAEALRLSRKFASPEAASFVNAILDNLYKMSMGEKPDHVTLEKASQELLETEVLAQEASQLQPLSDDDSES
jgi:N utilization substance protein B